MSSPVELLRSQQLVVVTGKGGVGKTTVAAALTVALAGLGRRVLLLEADPRESAHHVLDTPPTGGEMVAVEQRVWLHNLSPRRVMDEVVRERLKWETLVGRVLASPVYEHFVGGAPGLKELALLGHAWRVLNGRAGAGTPPVHAVVLDAPASGHGVALLQAPGLVAEVIRTGPFARMAREIRTLVEEPARCAVVVVTTLEEMPVQEALELLDRLAARTGRSADLVVANAVLPPLGEDADASDPAAAGWQRRWQAQQREWERLRQAWEGRTAHLPLLALEPGRPLVDALGERLRGGGG